MTAPDFDLALRLFLSGMGTGAKSAVYSLGQSGHGPMVTPLEAHSTANDFVTRTMADPLQRLTLEEAVHAILNGRPSTMPVDGVVPPTGGAA